MAKTDVTSYPKEKIKILFLELYIKFADKKYQSTLMEAMCIQMDRKGDGFKILEKLKEYEAKGGTD